MPCGWEGNRSYVWRRTGHASQTTVVYPPTGSQPRQGDEHPAYTVLWSMAHLGLPLHAQLPLRDVPLQDPLLLRRILPRTLTAPFLLT